MRVMFGALVLASAFSVPILAAERPDEFVKAAIAAAGGADVLAKYPAGRVVGKGTITFGTVETPFTFEQAYQMPGRFRTVVRAEVKGQKWELLQVAIDGDAKQTINGRTIPLTDAALKDLRLAALLNEVAQLIPLTTDRKFTLKSGKTVKGVETTGFQVLVRGYPELRLVFDRKTGHLVRIGYKSPDPDTTKETDTETIFADFKEVAGLTRPTRSTVTRDGKTVVELVVDKYTPLEKIDPKAFTIEE